MHHLPSVAVVILNWNGIQFLQQFLPSVLASTYQNYKVVVADNASTDESISFLQNNYPQIEIIQLDQNFGFAKGYNEALKKVQADYFVLLNSDVEVTPGWLQPMIELLETNPKYGACQPKLLDYNKRNFFEYAGACGGWIDCYGYPFARGRMFDICEEDKGQYDNTQQIFWGSGAALLVRSSAFRAVHGFDEFFFAHQEEIDLCWRMQLSGYKIFCCPQSIVYHVGGGTLPKGNPRKVFLNFRNNHIMLWKNLPLSEKWWKVPFRLVLDWISALKGLLTGDEGYFFAILKAHAGFAKWVFGKERKKDDYEKRKLKTMEGVYKGNIVWEYFVRKRKTFSEFFLN